MTCIIGIADGKSVWMGGDSWAGNAYDGYIRRDQKVFQVGSCLIGYTNSFRMGQLLQFKLDPDIVELRLNRVSDDNLLRYMATVFVDEVRRVMKENGFTTRENDVETIGTFLIGCRGRLFKIDPDMNVMEVVGSINYMSIGCGDQFARGAIVALLASGSMLTFDKFIETGLAAAAYCSGNVRPPFTILTI